MSKKALVTALATSLAAGGLLAPPAMAQVIPFPLVQNPPPLPAQVSAFSRAVGINETCTKAYLAASNNTFPQSLGSLSQFMVLSPAADLCSSGAVASAQNNTPAPTASQTSAYAQSVGVNQTCMQAFVLHANSLPTSLSELNQFQLAAPAADLCSQAAITAAISPGR